MEANLIAGLAGIIGLILGRFWDSHAESRRWRRDQRIRAYEQVGCAYYALRESIRAVALAPIGSEKLEKAALPTVDLGKDFNSAAFAVWVHESEAVAISAKQSSSEVNELYLAAREREFSWDEWRAIRAPAEKFLEHFVGTVRFDLSLPQLTVAIRIVDPELNASQVVNAPDGLGAS